MIVGRKAIPLRMVPFPGRTVKLRGCVLPETFGQTAPNAPKSRSFLSVPIYIRLVVSTHLKNMSQNWDSFPNRGEQKKNIPKTPPKNKTINTIIKHRVCKTTLNLYVFFICQWVTPLALDQRSLPGKTSATRCHPPGPELLTIVGCVGMAGSVYPPRPGCQSQLKVFSFWDFPKPKKWKKIPVISDWITG